MMDKEQSPQSRQPDYSDEIDIFRLCADLWERRIVIMACMLLASMCGFSYANLAPETFKAEVRLYPENDVGLSKTVLLLTATTHDELSADTFKLVQKHLTSPSTFLGLMGDSNITAILDKAFPKLTDVKKARALSRKVKVMPPSLKKKTEFITAKLEWSDSMDVVKLANAWVAFAVAETKSELIKTSLSSLNREIKEIDQLIEVRQGRARIQINNEILRLKEAKAIVNEIDVLNIASSDSLLSFIPEYTNVRNLRALYMIGGKALDAEIRALESRRDKGDYYVSGLLELEEKKAELMSVPLSADLINPVSGDKLSAELGGRAGLNHKLIVGLSLFFGLMLGLIIASIKIGFDHRVFAK
ncbi:MAG: Wzz/FepE/Etk N-terminal domain-containing protein [Porticoccus sp.]|nr:Wzz/FepE/Etk N-terminal domain-containing protein [Porticoccus sp.]